jgi:hypothetical protein
MRWIRPPQWLTGVAYSKVTTQLPAPSRGQMAITVAGMPTNEAVAVAVKANRIPTVGRIGHVVGCGGVLPDVPVVIGTSS